MEQGEESNAAVESRHDVEAKLKVIENWTANYTRPPKWE
jgi:hypothetical protein